MTAGKNKFNAVRVEDGGYTFDSRREHARWCELVLLEKAKVISYLVVHPVYTLRAFDSEICKMIPDFEYVENGKWIVEDVKSDPTVTPSFRIKLKLFHANFPSAEFRIIGLNKKYPSVKRKMIALPK
jgi:hypothetical protein